jgi:integrase
MGCVHVNRSLRTDSPSLAIRLARKAAFEIDAMSEGKRQQIGLECDERLVVDQDIVASVRAARSSRSAAAIAACIKPETLETAAATNLNLTLSDIYDRYIKDPTKRRSARTMLAHDTTRRVVQDVLGALTPISDISREQCRDLLETLRWLPVNHSKKYGKLSVRDAAALAKDDHRIKTINPTNFNAYMVRFATMMNWAVSEEYIGRNPARGLQWAETVHPQDRRQPFAPWQLTRIFNSPNYIGDTSRACADVGSPAGTGARYGVPLLALFSGARLNELCQLDVADIRMIADIACIVITEASVTGSRDKP